MQHIAKLVHYFGNTT